LGLARKELREWFGAKRPLALMGRKRVATKLERVEILLFPLIL